MQQGRDLNVGIARTIMRAIWGTNAKTGRAAEKAETDEMLAKAERKVARLEFTLDTPLDERPAANIDEALRQITARRQ